MKLLRPAVFRDRQEKGLLLRYFSREVSNGVYIDVGGNVPENSISRPFRERGWTGVVVEPIPENIERFLAKGIKCVWQGAVTSPEKARDKLATFHLAGGGSNEKSSLERNMIVGNYKSMKKIEVQLKTLNEVCADFGIDRVDFLSVDTEGTEIDVLQGFDLRKYDVTLALIEDWGLDFQIHRLMKANRYKRVRRTGFNSWYVKETETFDISLFGHLQMFWKYVIGMPSRNIQKWRKRNRILDQ